MMKTGEKNRLEFGGPLGNIALMIGLPLTIYYLYYSVRFQCGALWPFYSNNCAPLTSFWVTIKPTWQAAGMFVGWFLFQALLQQFMPGKKVQGVELDNGTRLTYRMNGPASFITTFVVLGLLIYFDVIRFDIIYNNFGALISVGTIFVFIFSLFLFIYGKVSGQVNRPSGSVVHDFFMGVSLNPRIPPVTGFDLKLFCEARPSLIGWLVVGISFMGTQYLMYGVITVAMALVVFMQFVYIADYFWHEPAILTTTDVVHDKFGFMLAFGDLAWVPLTYAIQEYYLIDHLHAIPAWGIVTILLLNFAGYYIFRAVNLQKHRFRTEPGFKIWGKEPEYIQTKRGSKLLVSGFWGWSRHFNYVGDIMMALAWCLPCLFGSVVPYFYVIYFTMLLIHRERRDDMQCSEKYGEDWQKYKKRVPWRIMPGIY